MLAVSVRIRGYMLPELNEAATLFVFYYLWRKNE